MDRCSLEPRQKFNLTVSAETLVSKQAERIGISLNGDLRSGGGLLKYLVLGLIEVAQYDFRID